MRTSVKDLEAAASQLSKLTDKQFLIKPSGTGSGYNLVAVVNGMQHPIRNAERAGDLLNYITTFQAGIEEGITLARDRLLPAVNRINKMPV